MQADYPVLSLKERDRRWKLVRELMKSKDLQCLLVPGFGGQSESEGYLANEHPGLMVVFPLEGEPTCLTSNYNNKMKHLEDIRRGGTAWIEDWRAELGPAGLVGVLGQKGLHASRIGTVGLQSLSGVEGGSVPYSYWAYVLERLPKATFVDITRPFTESIMVKSEEELVMARHCAKIGDAACQAMLDVTRPGVGESEIYAAVLNSVHRAGAEMGGIGLQTGVDNLGWGRPSWLSKGGPPRVVEKGEMVQAEFGPTYGGLHTQQQMSIALAPVHPVNAELAEVARRSYDAGLKFLRPGRTFGDLCEAMKKPLDEAGCYAETPLIHSVSPQWVVSSHKMAGHLFPDMKPRPLIGGDVVIKAGMLFAFEPDACRGRHMVNIGGTVLVTEDGAEELNSVPNEMHVVEPLRNRKPHKER